MSKTDKFVHKFDKFVLNQAVQAFIFSNKIWQLYYLNSEKDKKLLIKFPFVTCL